MRLDLQHRIEQALVVCLLAEALFINATNQHYAVQATTEVPAVTEMEPVYNGPDAGIVKEFEEIFFGLELPTKEQYELINAMYERDALHEEYSGFVSEFATWWQTALQLDIEASNEIVVEGKRMCVQKRQYNIRMDTGEAHAILDRGDFHIEEYYDTKEQTCYLDFDGYSWAHLTPAIATEPLWLYCSNNVDASGTVERIADILQTSTHNKYLLKKTKHGYEIRYVEDDAGIAALADLFATRDAVKSCYVDVSVQENQIDCQLTFEMLDAEIISEDRYTYSMVRREPTDISAPESCYWSMCDVPTLERKFKEQFQ